MTADAPSAPRSVTLGADEIRRECRNVLDWQVEAILATGASRGDLAAALAWLDGQDDVMGDARVPLTGLAAQVYDILAAGEEPEDEPGRSSPPM